MEDKNFKCLKDKYRLGSKIAKGGMSEIYLCTNIELGNQWVAKYIKKSFAGLIYEEEILKKLNHISLPKIIDICREESGIYIIESYIEGVSLQKKLECLGKLNVSKVIDYSLQLCEVLSYLHNLAPKAVIHKDLKPSNIIVTEYDRLVLIDFGISQELGEKDSGYRGGTNAYAPPEQLTGSGKGDIRWDIYSLGIVIHQMLTGELPGECTGTIKKTSFVYEKLLEISSKCSRFSAEDRYQKVEDVKNDLLYLRNKDILNKENSKLKRKIVLIMIGILSIINYICLFLGLILLKG